MDNRDFEEFVAGQREALSDLDTMKDTDDEEGRGAGTLGLKPNASVWRTGLGPENLSVAVDNPP